MATPKQVRRRGRLSFLLGTILAAGLFAAVAWADNVQNNVETSGDIVTVTAGGAGASVGYRIQATSGDGQTGCNASDGSTATVTPTGLPAGVAKSPSSISFAACTNTFQSIVFTAAASVTPGDYVINVSVSDSGAGTYNTSPARFTLRVQAPADSTPPVITPNISGTEGDNGWYTSNVTVTWNVADSQSAISSSTGCGSTTISSDTTGTTLTCSATSAGGTSSESVTIKRDATAPSVTVSLARASDHNGWYNQAVGYGVSARSDATSEIASCQTDATYNGPDDASASVTRTCTDNAGNVGSGSASFKYDDTNPSVTVSLARASDHNGWYNQAVGYGVSTQTDLTSGIESCQPDATYNGPDDASASVTRTCIDNAGNVGSGSASFKYDSTGPSISGSAAPPANANGWNNTSVTLSFLCGDEASGVASCGPNQTLANEGANQSASGTAVDNAGNSASDTVSGISIDKTVPSVNLVGGPAAGGTYYYGFVPAAPTCSASDSLSGLDGACQVSGYSNAVGSHTVSATASDQAGNTASDSRSYSVLSWTLRGFYQPVDMSGVFNTVKNGSTVPLKFEIFAGGNELSGTAYVKSLTSAKIGCDASAAQDDVELTATGSTTLRYDTTAGQYIYNWQTPRTAGQCYRVTMTTQDGSSLQALFRLK